MTATYAPRAPKRTQGGFAATAGALALATAFVATHEGEVRRTYVDYIGKGGAVLTYCYGATEGARIGQTFTHEQCVASLRTQLGKHAQEAQDCLTRRVPDASAAAFYSLAYNIGAPAFCRSSVVRKANAGDLAGACRAVGLYVYSNGRDCRNPASRCSGIVTRRAQEVALCMRGLT